MRRLRRLVVDSDSPMHDSQQTNYGHERRFERVGDTLLVSYSISDEFAPEFTETYDIALGGIAMITNAELQKDAPIAVQLELRGDSRPMIQSKRHGPLVALRPDAAALSHGCRIRRRGRRNAKRPNPVHRHPAPTPRHGRHLTPFVILSGSFVILSLSKDPEAAPRGDACAVR